MLRAVMSKGSLVSTTRLICSRRAPAAAASGPTASRSAAPLSASTPGLYCTWKLYSLFNDVLETVLVDHSIFYYSEIIVLFDVLWSRLNIQIHMGHNGSRVGRTVLGAPASVAARGPLRSKARLPAHLRVRMGQEALIHFR